MKFWKAAAAAAAVVGLVGIGTLLGYVTGGTPAGSSSSCHAHHGLCPTTTDTTVNTTTTAPTTTTQPTTTQSTTTTTGTPPLFTGDWETGNSSQWTQTQCAGYGYTPPPNYVWGNISFVTSPVAQGTYAAQFDLPIATGGNDCETWAQRTLNTGSDDYYGIDVMFPTNWQEPSTAGWGMAVAQMNFENIWGSPVSLRAHSNYLRMVLMSGACVYQSTGCPTTIEKDAIPVGQLTLGVWHQMIVHVHWASDNTGVVETWHRLKGDPDPSWVLTSSTTGVPTVQWNSGGSPLDPSYVTYDGIGAYRGQSSFPLTIWDDGFCRATTFDDAAACL